MKVLKVLSIVALLAPGLSYAEGTEHSAAQHDATTVKKEEVKAEHATEPTAHVDASVTVSAKPAVAAEEKTDKKSFCAKSQDEATKKCNTWLTHQKSHHKDKLVDSKCSEPTAATKTDKGCKAGSHISHGEVKFQK